MRARQKVKELNDFEGEILKVGKKIKKQVNSVREAIKT